MGYPESNEQFNREQGERLIEAVGNLAEASKFNITYLNIENEFFDEVYYPYLTYNGEKISADQLLGFINSGMVYINETIGEYDYTNLVNNIMKTPFSDDGLVAGFMRGRSINSAFTSEWTYSQIDEFNDD